MISQQKRIVATIFLIAAACVTTACGEKEITTVKTEADAIEILDLLNGNGLEARKEETGEAQNRQLRITVDEGWFGGGHDALAWQILRDHGLPRDPGEERRPETSGWVPPSEAILRMQQIREQKNNIERQLRMMPGVTRASVNIVMAQDPLLVVNRTPPSASVMIVHRDMRPPFTSEQIQQQVARAVQDLRPENVTVTMTHQAPRPIPLEEIEARRRRNMIVTGGIALFGLLTLLLGALIMKSRRKRRIAPDGETDAQALEENAGESEDHPRLTTGDRLLAEGDEIDETDATKRQLPAA